MMVYELIQALSQYDYDDEVRLEVSTGSETHTVEIDHVVKAVNVYLMGKDKEEN